MKSALFPKNIKEVLRVCTGEWGEARGVDGVRQGCGEERKRGEEKGWLYVCKLHCFLFKDCSMSSHHAQHNTF